MTHNAHKIKHFSLWILSAMVMVFSPEIVSAQSTSPLFTIFPSYTHQDNFQWIIHDINPGNTIRDFLTVENLSDSEITLKLFFKEADEDNNGVFKPVETQDYQHLGKFLKLEKSQITLEPKSKQQIAFTLAIPEKFQPSNYKGVIFAENTTKSPDQNSIPITTRIGVRAYINITTTPILNPQQESPQATDKWPIKYIFPIILLITAIILAFHRKPKTKLMILGATLASVSASAYFIASLANAQVMEVEITKGGYLLKGPREINFNRVETSFDEKISELNMRELTEFPYIEIEDQNGGTPFSVSVSASNFISDKYAISNENLFIRNNDLETPTIQIIEGSGEGIELNPTTDDFVPLNETQTILDRNVGENPGKWHIFPSLKLVIPQKAKSGIYTTNITFTII